MSKEIQIISTPNSTIYALIRDQEGAVWNDIDSTWDNYISANQIDYAVACEEQGSGSGYYTGDFPVAIEAGVYNLIGYLQAGGNPDSSDQAIAEGQIVWSGTGEISTGPNYIDLDYFKMVHKINNSNDDAMIQVYINAAQDAVIKYLCRDIAAQAYDDYFAGSGNSLLQLPNYPVISLTSITILPRSTQPTEITADKLEIDFPRGQVAVIPSQTPVTSFPFYGQFWPQGFQSIRAQYVAGYNAIPESVKLATALIAFNMYKLATADPTVTLRKIDDYEERFDRLGANAFSLAVRTMLDKYRRIWV